MGRRYCCIRLSHSHWKAAPKRNVPAAALSVRSHRELRSRRLAGRVPLRSPPLPRRGLPVEIGTTARTYPFSAGTLALEGAVRRGEASKACCGLVQAVSFRPRSLYLDPPRYCAAALGASPGPTAHDSGSLGAMLRRASLLAAGAPPSPPASIRSRSPVACQPMTDPALPATPATSRASARASRAAWD
jgi:hypothetical protein